MGGSGSAVVITGDVMASEDLTIDGQATGTIERTDYVLTIGLRPARCATTSK